MRQLRPGVSSRTFAYLSYYTWHQVGSWLRRQHRDPPQAVKCPSCGELIHPPEFYVRKGNGSRPLDVWQAHEYIRDHWG